ncbi:MAG: sulfite exporter TauE/SafE family protein [Gemmatimonadota bacterium]
MATFWHLWWVFPASVAFSTVAIGSGISGALFFSPFFMLVVGLSPAQAVGAGLLTEVFGMGNGLRSYVRQGLVDYATARWLLAGSLPAVVLGAILADRLPGRTLKLIFGGGLLVLAAFLVFVPPAESCDPGSRSGPLLERRSRGKGVTVVRARDGTVFEYPTCWRLPGWAMAVAGGWLTGLISAGLPEISTTQLVVRCRVPPRVAVATSVFTLALVAGAGAAVHALNAEPPWHVVGWSIPGVLVGSAIGSRVGRHLPSHLMEKLLGGVFALVGGLVLALELLR